MSLEKHATNVEKCVKKVNKTLNTEIRKTAITKDQLNKIKQTCKRHKVDYKTICRIIQIPTYCH